MADDKDKSVRRFGRKDRKSKIEVDHSRFMPKREADFPDLSDVDMPDPDADALQSLERMDDVMRPLVITPQEERYPPIPSLEDEPPAPKPRPVAELPSNRGKNLFTFLMLVLTAVVIGYYAFIWNNPLSILNPLAPPTPFVVITATVDANPVFVASPQPTLADGQPTATPALDDLHPFAVSSEGVLYVSNQNGRECNWASIAGGVTNTNGEPLPGFGIKVTGDGVSATVFSGTNSTFGAGGYELSLGGVPMVGNFTVQLVTTGGAPLSAEMVVITRDDCNQNVAIVNFVQK